MRAGEDEDARFRARMFGVVHAGNPGDVAFYLEACAGARAVLELGCGAGRILAPLAEAGLDVTGVEVDPHKLELARRAVPPFARERVALVEADARSLDLGRRFDRVVAPFNMLCALPSDEDVAACLATAARHLAPDGLLVLDVYAVDEDLAESELLAGEGEETFLFTWQDGPARVDVFERERPTRDPRRFDMIYRYRVTPEGGGEPRDVEEAISHLALPRSVLVRLMARAGLQPVTEEGDFAGAPFDEASAHLVIGAKPRRS